MRRAWPAVLIGSLALAQTFDRTHPPEPGPPRPFRLPSVYETRLPNGLTVVLVDDQRTPMVTARLAFRCGIRRDPKDLPGVAEAVAELMTQGTRRRSFVQIAEAIDNMGGTLTGTAGADHVAINGSIQSERAVTLLDIMLDVARNADFSSIDVRLYRQNRKQILLRQFGQAAFVANSEFRKAIFGDHPYAHFGPTLASLEKLDRQSLVDYRDRWLVPNNGFLLLVGKLPPRADMVKLITERFGPWEQKALPETPRAPLPAPVKKLILIDRPGAVQADVRMGKVGATQRGPDYFAEIAAAEIAGGVPIGRLFLDLREKRGFVYDVRAERVAFDEAGILAITTQVRNDAAGDAIRVMLDHLNRIGAEPVTEKELSDAKSFTAGSFMLGLETQAGLADELMVGRIQGLPADYLDKWRSRLEEVRIEEVQAAAKKYLSASDNVVVVVGDAAKLGPVLQTAGKFEVVKAVP
jgi:zinc protease